MRARRGPHARQPGEVNHPRVAAARPPPRRMHAWRGHGGFGAASARAWTARRCRQRHHFQSRTSKGLWQRPRRPPGQTPSPSARASGCLLVAGRRYLGEGEGRLSASRSAAGRRFSAERKRHAVQHIVRSLGFNWGIIEQRVVICYLLTRFIESWPLSCAAGAPTQVAKRVARKSAGQDERAGAETRPEYGKHRHPPP